MPPATFLDLKQALSAGNYRKLFPIGTILPDTWSSTFPRQSYNAPLRIVDYRPVSLFSPDPLLNNVKKLAAILLRVYVHPSDIRFGNPSDDDWVRYDLSYVHKFLNLEKIGHTPGYLSGCSDALLQAISPINLQIPISATESITAPARFFLPTPEQLHFSVDGSTDFESETWEYFLDTPTKYFPRCDKRAFTDVVAHGARFIWLRTSHPRFLYSYFNGYLFNTDLPSAANRPLPACTITAD